MLNVPTTCLPSTPVALAVAGCGNPSYVNEPPANVTTVAAGPMVRVLMAATLKSSKYAVVFGRVSGPDTERSTVSNAYVPDTW